MVAVYEALPTSAVDGVKVTLLPLTPTVPLTAAPPVRTSVTLDVVSVALAMDSENVALIVVLCGTAVAPFAGDADVTVGAVTSGATAVVNDQLEFAASAFPARSFTAFVMVAVYCVPATSATAGVNVAVLPTTLTVPFTAVPPPAGKSVKPDVVKVAVFIASENVAVTTVDAATFTALFTGLIAEMVGGVTSAVAAVVNDQLAFAASALPARSVAAVVIVAVYCVFAVSAAAGVTITVLPFTATVPAIRAPVPVRTSVTLAVVSVAFAIGSENVASTVGSSATDIAPSAGIVDVTVGATLSVGGAATVVNVATVLAASALPARSRTAVVIVIWYCVPAVNAGAGVNVAVFPLTDTEPVTGVADPIVTSWTLVAVMVLRVIASENVTDTGEFSATPVAPSAGDIAVTVGAVVSLGGPGGCVTSPPPLHANSAAHTTWVACRNLRTPRGRFAA